MVVDAVPAVAAAGRRQREMEGKGGFWGRGRRGGRKKSDEIGGGGGGGKERGQVHPRMEGCSMIRRCVYRNYWKVMLAFLSGWTWS